MQKLDINTWARKDHFHFFKQFEEPFFGVVVTLDCTATYEKCKKDGHSFFLYYLYQSLAAANEIEPFRYRIVGEDVVIHNTIDASATINRPDGTFGFSYMPFHPDYAVFEAAAKQEITRVQQNTGLELAASNDHIIHYSSIPWLNFTSLSHARAFSFNDCIPKISFGKMTENNGIKTMPVSIHVHHALMDGYHVGQLVERLQEKLG
jgi:chloramphenicol O-acetyltransferase type A